MHMPCSHACVLVCACRHWQVMQRLRAPRYYGALCLLVDEAGFLIEVRVPPAAALSLARCVQRHKTGLTGAPPFRRARTPALPRVRAVQGGGAAGRAACQRAAARGGRGGRAVAGRDRRPRL
jgi:hypothetical protein